MHTSCQACFSSWEYSLEKKAWPFRAYIYCVFERGSSQQTTYMIKKSLYKIKLQDEGIRESGWPAGVTDKLIKTGIRVADLKQRVSPEVIQIIPGKGGGLGTGRGRGRYGVNKQLGDREMQVGIRGGHGKAPEALSEHHTKADLNNRNSFSLSLEVSSPR